MAAEPHGRSAGDAAMVTPGLYRHYKGPLYRVLFVADWLSKTAPESDEVLEVFLVANRIYVSDVRDKEDREHFGDGLILDNVRWSGNTSRVNDERNKRVVIYVSLSDDGRVSARTVREFEEMVDVPCADGGPSHRVPRFERIGE